MPESRRRKCWRSFVENIEDWRALTLDLLIGIVIILLVGHYA